MRDRQEDLSAAVLGLAALIVAADRFRLAAARHFAIDVVETHAISYLDTYGPMTQTRLARLMGLTSGGVTGLVDRLERSGTARRAPDPHDRRRNRIELTDRSEAMLAESRVGLARPIEELDPAVLATVVDVFPRLADGLNREADTLGEPEPG